MVDAYTRYPTRSSSSRKLANTLVRYIGMYASHDGRGKYLCWCALRGDCNCNSPAGPHLAIGPLDNAEGSSVFCSSSASTRVIDTITYGRFSGNRLCGVTAAEVYTTTTYASLTPCT